MISRFSMVSRARGNPDYSRGFIYGLNMHVCVQALKVLARLYICRGTFELGETVYLPRHI